MDADTSPQRKLQQPVLWFALTALLLLLALIGGVAWKQGAFAKTTQLYFFAKTAYGMNKGMAVKFSGFRIGSVEEVSLEPNGSVKVRMVIDNAYTRFVPKDSKGKQVALEGRVKIQEPDPEMVDHLKAFADSRYSDQAVALAKKKYPFATPFNSTRTAA